MKIPLFPLPGVVLFPGTLLPLHIFEPRYRRMVEDALSSHRTIGMALLKGGAEFDEGRSPIHEVGGAGEIVESERLDDGRFNILLQGKFRYRVLGEDSWDPYRVARVEELASAPFATTGEERQVVELSTSLFGRIAPEIDLPPLPAEDLEPERLASEIALRLRYSPAELQSLLEMNSLPARFGTLIGRMVEWEKRVRFLAPFRPPDLDVTRN